MERMYQKLVQNHLKQFRQMVFLAGPRQVGKTTIAKNQEKGKGGFFYFNFRGKKNKT